MSFLVTTCDSLEAVTKKGKVFVSNVSVELPAEQYEQACAEAKDLLGIDPGGQSFSFEYMAETTFQINNAG